jgi:hypothetical protein
MASLRRWSPETLATTDVSDRDIDPGPQQQDHPCDSRLPRRAETIGIGPAEKHGLGADGEAEVRQAERRGRRMGGPRGLNFAVRGE